MQEESLQLKQSYLRDQIINSGIDAEAFMEFMGRQKAEEENIDLNNWTLKELQKVVEVFKAQVIQEKQANPVAVEMKPTKQIKKTKIFQSGLKKQKVKYDNGLWDFEIKMDQQCGKAVKRYNFDQKFVPTIRIEKSEIKTVGGFIFGIGSKRELQITFSTNFTESKIIRKCEDFDWLREMLVKNYAGFFIPPLQVYRQIEPEDKVGVSAKMHEIDRFINSCIRYEYLHTSLVLKCFLEESSSRKFHDYKTKQSSYKVQKDSSAIETLDGKFTVEISESVNNFIKKSSMITQDVSKLYNELATNIDKVLEDMDRLCKHILYLSNNCGKLHEKMSDLSDNLKEDEFKSPTMLLYFNNLLSTCGKNVKRHMRGIKDFSNLFVRPAENDWNQFVVHDKRQQAETINYLNFKLALLKKKEKYIGDITKWEIPEIQIRNLNKKGVNNMSKDEKYNLMFPSENEIESEMRVWLSFINNNYKKSLKTMIKSQEKEMLIKFLKYSLDFLCLSEEVNMTYKKFNEMMIPPQ